MARGKNLQEIFSPRHEWTVGQDSTAQIAPRLLRIEKTCWRAMLADCRVAAYEHLNGS